MDKRVTSSLAFRPIRIYNYPQLITQLKLLQLKLSKYRTNIKTGLTNFLKPKHTKYNVADIVDGFLHSKLKNKQKDREQMIDSVFKNELKAHVSRVKQEYELQSICTSKICSSVDELEEMFDLEPTSLSFGDPMLFDIYGFLKNAKIAHSGFKNELAFLNSQYIKYIERFLKENADKIKEPINTIEEKVHVFVKLKYNRDEYNLEVYEQKYVFAEIYILYRCGFISSILSLFDKYHSFFEHISHKFKQHFTSYLTSSHKLTSPFPVKATDDKFKVFLVNLMDNAISKSDSYIINTIEDFIWLQLIASTDTTDTVLELFENYKSQKGLLLVYCMLKRYAKALELVYKAEFKIIPSYYIMKELIRHCREYKTKLLFVDFVFLIASKFSSIKRRVSIIESLKLYINDYYTIIPQMIVKNGLYSVVGIDDGTVSYLDKKVNYNLICLLKEKGHKKQLVELHYLIDDDSLVIEILIDCMSEAILTGMDIDGYMGIVNKYEKNNDTKDVEMLKILKNFYNFYRNSTISNLKRTALFDYNADLSKIKYVVERVIKTASGLVKEIGDREMAKSLFKICGLLNLSAECSNYVSKDLVLLI